MIETISIIISVVSIIISIDNAKRCRSLVDRSIGITAAEIKYNKHKYRELERLAWDPPKEKTPPTPNPLPNK